METIFMEESGLNEIDRHFGAFICRVAGTTDAALGLAASLASRAVNEGHVCLDLEEAASSEAARAVGITDAESWGRHLAQWPVVGRPGDFTPLVLDGSHRLYLHRYWAYERELATALPALAADRPPLDSRLLKAGLARVFQGAPEEVDLQQVAAVIAASRRFSVIAGGPGTGKTSTVLRVLLLLLDQYGGNCRIALAAPTGKAAARLRESILQGLKTIDADRESLERIPHEVSTIHRLLGYVPGSSGFRHNRENPLPVDVVVIDEASMVSLPLTAKVVAALRPSARLILLGDRDQLASVEAGAVLGDICDTGAEHPYSVDCCELIRETTGFVIPPADPKGAVEKPLTDSIVILRKSYRFAGGSGIGELGRLVNSGDGTGALRLLRDGIYEDVSYVPLPQPELLEEQLQETIFDRFGRFLRENSPQEKLAAFDDFRILCALRRGPYGTVAINRLVERVLAAKGLLFPNSRWYHGQPVMITRNDYGLRLFNGDIGIILKDPASGSDLRAFFATGTGSLRSILPLRLPQHETAFAMTVHRSQGSEFDRAMLLLPDRFSELMSRELVYTALTRAKKGLEIFATDDIFIRAVNRRIERKSGLREVLWGGK